MVFVLMADIIDSSSAPGGQLMASFKDVVASANASFKSKIDSPLTITLGDEFQGIIANLPSSIDIIFHIEELLIGLQGDFQLRYVLNYGEVDTPINHENAHEMLGAGLTDARRKLNEVKKSDTRFHISVQDSEQTNRLNAAFYLYQHIQEGWQSKDFKEVSLFLEGKNYKEVAEITQKDESSAWRRERSLGIKAYNTSKSLIRSLVK